MKCCLLTYFTLFLFIISNGSVLYDAENLNMYDFFPQGRSFLCLLFTFKRARLKSTFQDNNVRTEIVVLLSYYAFVLVPLVLRQANGDGRRAHGGFSFTIVSFDF